MQQKHLHLNGTVFRFHSLAKMVATFRAIFLFPPPIKTWQQHFFPIPE
jgi:hypothetical protein